MARPGDVGFGGLPAAFLNATTSSFSEFLSLTSPHLLPGRGAPPDVVGDDIAPHGTTIVAVTFAGGVVVAGDRRATMGNLIAQRDIRKVFAADDNTVIAYAGTVSFGVEFIRLFQVELEHYEKVEGIGLTLDGKANRLAAMIRGHLPMAMQGFVAVPLLAGFDPRAADSARAARVYGYDAAGGCNEERGFHAIGSGSVYAKASLKKGWREAGTVADARYLAVEALFEAADEDTATGGPDLSRRIFPVIITVDADGAREEPEGDVASIAEAVAARHSATRQR